jgi:hypothetical protein
MAMKRSVALSVILVFAAAIAVAQAESSSTRFSSPLLNDIVRMSKSGLSDATVVAYVKARLAWLDSILSAEDLIKMRRAGVSETVTQYLASVTAIDTARSGEGRRGEMTYDSREGTVYPVEPVYGGGYDYPYGYYPPYFSSSAVFIGRPFFHHRFFFHHPFSFSHQPSFRRQFFPHRFFNRSFFGRRFR